MSVASQSVSRRAFAVAGVAAGAGVVATAFVPKAGHTPREAQVFALLVQGRSRVFIQEELGLSDSTIKAHASHVYQKLGVHSKRELISLVREA